MADSRSSVDLILEKTNLIELIGEVTPLQKKGKNHMGLCPFHDEKTPSFSVSEDKQLYHCFSCKASGNAITFVKETQGLSSADALKILAERAGLSYDVSAEEAALNPYYQINEEALTFFKVMLQHTEEGIKAKSYALKRGMSEETLKTFGIGYAPSTPDALTKALLKQSYLQSDLIDVGLTQGGPPPYDFYRQRLMFPLHDSSGRVVGFSGRTLNKDIQPKYINTATSPVFEKNQILYNLHRAKRAIKATRRVVMFEGFMDAIAAHQAGLEESVALMGTALTSQHLKQLEPLCDRVVLCLDGDAAGLEATRRSLEMILKHQLDVRIVMLPDGLDPDDTIKQHGTESFIKRVDEALSHLEFRYITALKQFDVTTLEGLEAIKSIVFAMLAKAPLTTQRHYLERLAQAAAIQPNILIQDFEQLFRFKGPIRAQKLSDNLITDKFQEAERLLIHYFLKDEVYSRMFRLEFDDLTYVDKPARDLQFEIFEYYDHNPQSCLILDLFKASLPLAQQEYLKAQLFKESYPYHRDEFEDLLKTMHAYQQKQHMDALKTALKETTNPKEKQALRDTILKLKKEQYYGKRKDY